MLGSDREGLGIGLGIGIRIADLNLNLTPCFIDCSEQQTNQPTGDLSASVTPTYESINPSTDSVIYSGLQRYDNDYEDAA